MATTVKPTVSNKKSRKTRKPSAKPDISKHPDLQDTFHQDNIKQERQFLMEEHQLKLNIQQQMHQARLDQMKQQLQRQLLTIWNELWLQRQKAADKSFKEWLKVFAA